MDWIVRAGPFVWPIVLASIVGAGLFLERALTLLRFRVGGGRVVGEVVELARAGRRDDALGVARSAGDPVARVVRTLLEAVDRPGDERDRVVRVAGERQIQRMERGLRTIALVARIAPLLGLLGTVVGLVEAFRAVSTMEGPPDPSVLAGGIWQALLTTVAGLLVAIPALVSHEWLQGRIDETVLRMQEAVTDVLTACLAAPRPPEEP